MERKPPSEKRQAAEPPAPEVLHPREAVDTPAEKEKAADRPVNPKRLRRTYRPSHKATFLGLAIIIVILAINAGAIAYVLKAQSKNSAAKPQSNQVTISSADLSKLGVNRSSVSDLGVQLEVGPNARFDGKLAVAGDTTIGGKLILNGAFSTSSASLAQLQAGNTTLNTLTVNGNTTLSNTALRNNLAVAGNTTLQGPVTITQLLTVNNSTNISGNLAVGGVLAVNDLHVTTFTADNTVTFGGHIITRGPAVVISKYANPAYGSNGTASVSGSDAAGTVGINTGAGAGASNGCLVRVYFTSPYASTPHVVITPMGNVGSFWVANKTVNGFDICVGGPLGSGQYYSFDYMVEQ